MLQNGHGRRDGRTDRRTDGQTDRGTDGRTNGVKPIYPPPTTSLFGGYNNSYSPETLNSGQNWPFFVPCDLEIWLMTLKNNRAPLQCYFKLCASFGSHWWIQTRVSVRKCPIWVQINYFFSHVTLKFDRWPWKTIGHLSLATSSSVHRVIIISEFNLLQSGNG